MAIEIEDPDLEARIRQLATRWNTSIDETVARALIGAILSEAIEISSDPVMQRAQVAALEDRLHHLKALYELK
jgi:hypothetical protein